MDNFRRLTVYFCLMINKTLIRSFLIYFIYMTLIEIQNQIFFFVFFSIWKCPRHICNLSSLNGLKLKYFIIYNVYLTIWILGIRVFYYYYILTTIVSFAICEILRIFPICYQFEQIILFEFSFINFCFPLYT